MDRKFCVHSWLAACNAGTIDRGRYARSGAVLLRAGRADEPVAEFSARGTTLLPDKRGSPCFAP